MNELEIFDKNGTALNIVDVMRSFLKNSLSIELSISTERDYYDEYSVINVSLLLDGEEICKSSDSIR